MQRSPSLSLHNLDAAVQSLKVMFRSAAAHSHAEIAVGADHRSAAAAFGQRRFRDHRGGWKVCEHITMEGLEAQLTEIAVLKERLEAGLPEQESEWTNEQRAQWLLAQLLEWHRREDKSMWWEYYRLCTLSDDELIEDKNALGGLVYVGVVEDQDITYPPV